ncbi:MAG: LuxR C-terminal-related transcriptional regulator [Burkholderiaceae bacterium]
MAASDKQQISFCTAADGTRIAYATVGSDRRWCAPALAQPPRVRLQSPVWRPWLAELRGRTPVRYDDRACGLSDWDVADISFDSWFADLEAAVSAAGLARFALFGMSRAPLAIAYAVRHPQRVSHLVLAGGFARGRCRRGQPQQADEMRVEHDLVRLGWGRENRLPASLHQPVPAGRRPRADPLVRRPAARLGIARERRPDHRSLQPCIDVVDLLPQVKVPTLVLHARRRAHPVRGGRLLASGIPGARFVPLDGTNHAARRRACVGEVLARGPRIPRQRRRRLGGPRRPCLRSPAASGRCSNCWRGLANDEIAERLGIAAKTVRNQVSAIFDKLQVSTRAQAIVCAREAGLGSQE